MPSPKPRYTSAPRCIQSDKPRSIPTAPGNRSARAFSAGSALSVIRGPHPLTGNTFRLRQLAAEVIPEHPHELRPLNPILGAKISPMFRNHVPSVSPGQILEDETVNTVPAARAYRAPQVIADRARREECAGAKRIRGEIEVGLLPPRIAGVP